MYKNSRKKTSDQAEAFSSTEYKRGTLEHTNVFFKTLLYTPHRISSALVRTYARELDGGGLGVWTTDADVTT